MATRKRTQQLEVTPLEKWKQKQGDLLRLPDGNVVRVRKLDLMDLAVSGYVPLKLVGSLMATGEKLQDPELVTSVSQEELSELNGMLRNVALNAVVDPRITASEEPDALNVDDLGFINLLTIFSASVDTSGAVALRPFRGK